jgi:hypothetical protein
MRRELSEVGRERPQPGPPLGPGKKPLLPAALLGTQPIVTVTSLPEQRLSCTSSVATTACAASGTASTAQPCVCRAGLQLLRVLRVRKRDAQVHVSQSLTAWQRIA